GLHVEFRRQGIRVAVPGERGEPRVVRMAFAGAFRGTRPAGAASLGAAAAASPAVVGPDRVVYRRSGVREEYEVRDDGIEQLFVFDALPEGRGDLVVALRVTTELVPDVVGTPVDELVLRPVDGAGGVRIGAITGIDANGERAVGRMIYADGMLELSLPAAFVDRAAMPLVLDPLIGPVFGTASWYGYGVAAAMDAAYSAAQGFFMLAWTATSDRCYPGCYAASYRVWTSAQRINRVTGVEIGGEACIECDLFRYSHGVRVAAVDGAGAFLFAWWEGRFVVGALEAQSGQYPGRAYLPLWADSWDVGGDVAGKPSGTLVLTTQGDACAFPVDCSGRTPVVGRQLTLAQGGDGPPGLEPAAVGIRVSSNAGRVGRYLVVWRQAGDLFGAVVDPSLRLLARSRVARGVVSGADSFDVDGDGTTWLVAYTVDRTASRDVAAVSVTWNATTRGLDISTPFMIAASPVREESPVVAFADDAYLVGYVRPRSSSLVAVDPLTGAFCEQSTVPGVQALAAETGGDHAILGWGGSSTVSHQMFLVADGVTRDLGGGCGHGGEARAACAVRANRAFELRLRGAPPGVPAIVAVGPRGTGIGCGPCQLVPDPAATAWVPAGVTSGAGRAALQAPIPTVASVVGSSFVQQWLLWSGTACHGAFALSNALEVRVQ
ncbi:MAG: hypothetical protein AAF628_38285, partial [Planctomycetota bacterium]